MDAGHCRLALAAAIVRTCPSQWSLPAYISYIRKKMRQEHGVAKPNRVLTALEVNRNQFIRSLKRKTTPLLYSPGEKQLPKKNKSDERRAERASSEETNFSGGDIAPSEVLCVVNEAAKTASPVLGTDVTSPCRINSPHVPVELDSSTNPSYIKHSDVPVDDWSSINNERSIKSQYHSISVKTTCSVPPEYHGKHMQTGLPACDHLQFLSAVETLTVFLDEGGPFLPQDQLSRTRPPSDEVHSAVHCVIAYVSGNISNTNIAWLSLLHSLDLAGRSVMHCPATSVTSLRQPVLQLITEIVSLTAGEAYHPRLLSCLCFTATYCGSVVRCLNVRIAQVSAQLQDTFRRELLQCNAPFSNPDVEGRVVRQHECDFELSGVFVLSLLSGVLDTLDTRGDLVTELYADLVSLISVLDKSTVFISDRYPRFVSEVFNSVRRINILMTAASQET